MPARVVQHVAPQVSHARRQIGRRDPAQRWMPAEPVEHVDQVRRETHAHGHIADGIFQDQVPADDPCNEFSHGRVRVGVRAARDGNHRCQLGVTQRGECAHNRNQHQRQCQCRPRARPPQCGHMMHDVVGQRRIEDRRGIELLTGDCGADDREDSRSDDRADSQRRQRPRAKRLLQSMFRLL